MGAETDDIQREIAEQRQRLGPRIRELRGRLAEDVKEAQATAQQRVSQVRRVADNWMAAIGGAFVAGLIVGMVVQGRRKDRERDRLLQESVRNWPWRSAPRMSGWPGR